MPSVWGLASRQSPLLGRGRLHAPIIDARCDAMPVGGGAGGAAPGSLARSRRRARIHATIIGSKYGY
jgi:hypothetical protein